MSFWSTITGTTPQDEQDANLAKQKDLYNAALQRRIDAGTITPEQVQKDRDYVAGVQNEDTDAAAWQGFQEGWQEGFNNVLGKLGSGIGNILKLVPWQLWIVGAAAAFFYFGGFGIVTRALKKK